MINILRYGVDNWSMSGEQGDGRVLWLSGSTTEDEESQPTHTDICVSFLVK
jgi:hypothetical protein